MFDFLLPDSRERWDYNNSHIITAKNAQRVSKRMSQFGIEPTICLTFFSSHFQDSKGMFVVPENVEVVSMRHIVVYDSDTSSVQDLGKSRSHNLSIGFKDFKFYQNRLTMNRHKVEFHICMREANVNPTMESC